MSDHFLLENGDALLLETGDHLLLEGSVSEADVIVEIMDEIAAQLTTALEAADFEVAVVSRMLFNPSTTAIDIYPDDPFRDEPTGGMGDVSGGYRFIVRARTGLNDLDSGQDILLALMDDDNDFSVAVSLEDEPTLNGRAQDVDVTGPSGFRPYRDFDGGTMVGVEWNVLVLAAHS